MTSGIFFSVVTPVLNGHDYALRYVNCLKSQVHTHWEALIVDDGSSDGTINFLRDLTYSDSRFRLLQTH